MTLLTFTGHAFLHNVCLRAGDILALEDEPENDSEENEVEADKEAVSGGSWRD